MINSSSQVQVDSAGYLQLSKPKAETIMDCLGLQFKNYLNNSDPAKTHEIHNIDLYYYVLEKAKFYGLTSYSEEDELALRQ
jgi:hypothetical protein